MSSAAVRLSFYIDKKVCKFFENFVNIFCRNSIFLLYCSKINLISETAMAGQVQPFPVRALPFMLKYAGIFRRPIIVSFALVLLAAMFSNLNDWLFAEIIASVRHLNIQDGFAQGVKYILYLSVCAGTTAWLTRFRNIYDTMVGEKGIKLSGGERQRIAIARAILKDAPILILDEATSALDNEAEQEVSEGIENLIAGKTVIAVAHRLSTLKAMDRIVVLDKGRIIEEGTPAELLKKGGKYAKLWKLQTV